MSFNSIRASSKQGQSEGPQDSFQLDHRPMIVCQDRIAHCIVTMMSAPGTPATCADDARSWVSCRLKKNSGACVLRQRSTTPLAQYETAGLAFRARNRPLADAQGQSFAAVTRAPPDRSTEPEPRVA